MNDKSHLRIIGMMSGTSVDSIDAALCDVRRDPDGRIRAEVAAFREHPIPATLRERIFRLFEDGTASLSLACSLNFEIGAAFADAAESLLSGSGVDPATVDAIASHGQTVYHIPPHMAEGAGAFPSTLQIGEAAVIAERTGLRVVCDFRVADMAAGGNGAPLVPFADFHLFGRAGETVVVHNIGGIANCTVLPASNRIGDVIAFDTGPGNMIMDALVQHFYPGETFDCDGGHARTGSVIPRLLDEWMAIPYVAAPPPKSTGRELFGVRFVKNAIQANRDEKPEDLIATAAEFTARSLAENLALHVAPQWQIGRLLLAGGGARNGFLVGRIRGELRNIPGGEGIRRGTIEEEGMESKARECVAFAVLGYARLCGIPANVPSATGARHPALLGKLVEPPPNRS